MTISVPTTDDDTNQEPDERFTVTLSNPSNATLNDRDGEGTIRDNDGGPAMSQLSIGDASVTEGLIAEFVVTLTPASSETVMVDYATADVTATAGEDYEPTTMGTLTFTPGQTSMGILVPTTHDTDQESDETLHRDPEQCVADGGHAQRHHR